MNSQLAVMVTLITAALSGFAIWQDDHRPVAPPVPAAPIADEVVAAAPAAVGRPPLAQWLEHAAARWLDRDLTFDLQRTEQSLSLRISWRERTTAVAAGR